MEFEELKRVRTLWYEQTFEWHSFHPFFLAPYPKGSATALPEGAFVVYLNLKKNYT